MNLRGSKKPGRGDLTRTGDLTVPNRVRYQLCYAPIPVFYHKTPQITSPIFRS